MTILEEFRRKYMEEASILGDYQNISVDELANKYCEALDEQNEDAKNVYISALMLRFWYTIGKLYKSSPNIGLDKEDFHSWLFEAISYACKYRAWQKPDSKCNAQQAINKCISTIRLQHYYEYNLDKHRANYASSSLDRTFKEDGENLIIDTIQDTTELPSNQYTLGKAEEIIQKYIDDKKLVEAIIFDNIAHNDVFKHERRTVVELNENNEEVKHPEFYSKFWAYKLVQTLNNLSYDYYNQFIKKYAVKDLEFKVALGAVQNANNQKKYKYIDRALADLKLVWNK